MNTLFKKLLECILTILSTGILYLPLREIIFEVKSQILENSPYILKEQFLQFVSFCQTYLELFLISPIL